MLILEHDAKALLAGRAIPVPAGMLVTTPDADPPFPAPWFVKAQVPAGGRGKAGGILRADDLASLANCLERLIGARIKGHTVRECRVEQAVAGACECYLSLSVDPAAGNIRVLLSARGGVDVEDAARRDGLMSATCGRDGAAIGDAVAGLAAALDAPAGPALADAGRRLGEIFCVLEATLLEINPLMVAGDGGWVAADVRMIADENALARQPDIGGLVTSRAAAYPEAALKQEHGFDYVAIDPQGDIGLVTTGAGLSMQLIDELLAQGCRPYNFCDIRSGNFRGDPARLIQVLRWIAAGPNVGSVLVNFFAGITHLGELSRLLLTALAAVPELRAPVTVRLVGNGLDEAQDILGARGIPVEPDLEMAVARAIAPLRGRS